MLPRAVPVSSPGLSYISGYSHRFERTGPPLRKRFLPPQESRNEDAIGVELTSHYKRASSRVNFVKRGDPSLAAGPILAFESWPYMAGRMRGGLLHHGQPNAVRVGRRGPHPPRGRGGLSFLE